MSLAIKMMTQPEDAANFIASAILNKLESSKRVLFFVTGGSSIAVGAKVAEILRGHLTQNLTITLTDERYGPIDHADSNWRQLEEKGFNLPQAQLIPVLTGDDRKTTTAKFNAILNEEFTKAEYKIGLFGIGTDGHTAGILPESGATHSQDLVYGYDTPSFSRITITFKAIEKLDEAVIWVGKEKWKVLENLKENIDMIKMPAQIFKKISLLTIFTNYQ